METEIKPILMMLMNDDGNHDNDHKIPVRGNVNHTLVIRNSLSCYKKKARTKK